MVTGTRAEYGLLKPVIEGIRENPALELQLVATGAHLSQKFGLTSREIEDDGFVIDRKVDMQLESDTPAGVTKSTSLAMMGFGAVFPELDPHLVLLLGDRVEALAAATAALIARIPTAHIHGGESTEGAIDEAIRHSVTKMSHLHFVAAEEYRRRVIQLGEDPARVFLVGGLGVDNIKRVPLLERAEVEAALGFTLGQRNLLVTFHPATLEADTSARQMSELLAALDALEGTKLIFTMPNADADSHVLFDMIETFVAGRDNARAFASLGQVLYLSCIKHVDAVVGNSSSGLTEVPSFGKGTINVGDRQRGRLKAASVIDCAPERNDIAAALRRLYSPEFRSVLQTAVNPYGEGGATERILHVLSQHSLEGLLKKKFYDVAQ